MEKLIKNLMFFWMRFLLDFGRFRVAKWDQVGTKIGSKIDVNFERRFFTKRTLAAAGARSAGLRGSKLGANMDQKSIKKWGQQGKASWHRFLSPSRPIWAPSWPYLGTSGAILVPSWRHVRSPCANFGRILTHFFFPSRRRTR